MGTTPVFTDDVRVRQGMNIDFFRVQDDAGGPAAFMLALGSAFRAQGPNRIAGVWGEPIGLYNTTRRDGLFIGEIGRIRMSGIPALANPDCTLEDLDVRDDQGVAELTAFIYDSRNACLVLHSRREAVSASRFAGYCDAFAGNREEIFVLKPILRRDAARRYRSMTTIKTLDVEYVRGAADALADPDQSTRGVLRTMRDIDPETLTISASSGRKKANKLSFEHVTEMVRTAMTSREETVKKLVVSGAGAGDERLVVDLIEERLRYYDVIDVRGRSTSFEQRIAVVNDAHVHNLPLLAIASE